MAKNDDKKNSPEDKNSTDPVNGVGRKARELEREIQNQSVDAMMHGEGIDAKGGLSTGYRATSSAATANAQTGGQAAREKAKDKRQSIADIILWLDRQRQFWEREYETWNREYEVWSGRVDAVADAIDRVERGEKIELGQDGYPADPELRATIKAYEAKHGTRIDPNNLKELRLVQEFAKANKNFAKDQRDFAEHQRNQVEQTRKALEENPNDPEALMQAQEMMRSETELKNLGSANTQVSSTGLQNRIRGGSASTQDDFAAMKKLESTGQSSLLGGTSDSFGSDDFKSTSASHSPSFARTQDPQGAAPSKLAAAFAPAAAAPHADSKMQQARTPAGPGIDLTNKG